MKMAVGKYMKDEFRFFRKAFRFNRRFGMVLLFEVLLVVALFVGVSVWANRMGALEPLLEKAAMPFSGSVSIENSLLLHNPEEAVGQLKSRLISYSIAIMLYILILWTLFKALTYTTLMGKKLTRKFYARFLLANIIWTSFMAVLFFIIQVVFYRTLFYQMEYSIVARVTFLMGSIIVFVLFCYFTIMFFLIFTRASTFRQTVINYWKVPLRKISSFGVPMLYALLLFIVLNILMRFLAFLPKSVVLLFNTFIVLAYIVLLKVYYSDCIDRFGKLSADVDKHVVRHAKLSEKKTIKKHITIKHKTTGSKKK